MSFDRNLLPEPENYFESRGHTLFGRSKKRFRIACSIHGGSSPNLSVHRQTGAWFCFSCSAKGGDVLAYEMQDAGSDFVTAAKALGAWTDDGRPSTYKPAPLSARAMLEIVGFEVQVAALLAADVAKGLRISEPDRARLFESARRIGQVAEVIHA